MTDNTTVQRCAHKPCHRVIEAKPTGRPARYCSPNCRQAAHRERAREAEAARQLAGQLAAARTAMQRLFPLAEETYHEAAELAGEVFRTMADTGREPGALTKALAAFAWAGQKLERCALDYQDAENTAQVLALVKLPAPGGIAPGQATGERP